jgi:hypothetical protein
METRGRYGRYGTVAGNCQAMTPVPPSSRIFIASEALGRLYLVRIGVAPSAEPDFLKIIIG